ncbi:hypothetical protein FLA_2277 [Filimonas lacunae]|nr:hypothetical protein FLA_2277 [Filimonas lacunae]
MQSEAQVITPAHTQQLKIAEDSLQKLGKLMVFAKYATHRFQADSLFIRNLVQALKVPNSFYYPFDSVDNISRIYAPDSTFRIFTWQFERDDAFHRQRGCIQMNTPDGSLKLFPLIDMSDYAEEPWDSVRSNFNWIGAIYYKMVMKTFNNHKYYTLIGLDDNNATTTKKWIDVLTFGEDGKPRFGGPFFAYKNDDIKPPQPAYRFFLEFKKDSRARMNYDAEMDMIVFEHLVSTTGHPDRRSSLVPDGDYEGFKWNNGRWEYVEKLFNFKLQDGQAPMPSPLKDDVSGKSDEKMLDDQSIKNMERNKQEAAEKAKPAPKKPAAPNKKLEQKQRANPQQGQEY